MTAWAEIASGSGYITSDPIGVVGGLNTFAYVENNPVNWFDPDGLKRVLRQITEIFNLTIDEFGSGRDKPRQARDRTIKYYTNVPDCFVLKSTEHFVYNNNVVFDTSKQLIPLLGAPTLTGQRVNITFYRYGPPSSGGCCKGTETPGGIEELLGRPELAEFLWKTLYSFIDSIGKEE